ncbi:energy-coupled thiamine transporter ThiT [Halalkalibacillus halophilus]|uniref:energy-coupled thiamine transporter ThiT n=1 Tax=Halalkalibacillus halophilus TaxID=392827 RepID=UPI0004013269|nr:energy-coupled thiamine transporter ThiT [Halalkalibacillus halophilus]
MHKRTLMIVEIAVFATLAFLLDTIPGLQFTIWPQGGSVSFAMIPIFIIAFRWGMKAGIISGLLFGFMNMLFGGYIVDWFQAFLDYILAFAVLGLAGIFSAPLWDAVRKANREKIISYVIAGVFLGTALRFASHFTGGIIFFGYLAPEGQSVWMYSLIYNSTYLVPGFILSAVILIIILITRPKLLFKEI